MIHTTAFTYDMVPSCAIAEWRAGRPDRVTSDSPAFAGSLSGVLASTSSPRSVTSERADKVDTMA